MSTSNYLVNSMLQNVFNGYSIGTNTLIISLSTTTPTLNGSGNIENVTKPVGGDYEDFLYDLTTMSWDVTNRTATNNDPIEFPVATASWGTVTHVVVYPDTGGPLFFGALATPANITAGTRFVIDAGGASVTIPTS